MKIEINDMLFKYELTSNMEKMFEWRKWIDEIPYLKFKPEWEVRAIPPISGAIIRYNIKYFDKFCSVYLDCYDMMGCVGHPYWELYPYNGDTFRCDIKDTDSLLNAIEHALYNTDEEILKGMINKGLEKGE